jgi:hypothetical protein
MACMWSESKGGCLRDECQRTERCTQAGPMMERHVIDGHVVLLPVGTKADPKWKEGDPLPGLGGCYD